MIGQPALPRVLLPVIAGNRGCALRRLYALREDVTENEAVLAAAKVACAGTGPTPNASRTWSPGSTIPATPTTGAARTSASLRPGWRTLSARMSRRPPQWP